MVNQVSKQLLVVGQEGDGQDRVTSDGWREFIINNLDDEVQELQALNLVNHVGVETHQRCHPAQLL